MTAWPRRRFFLLEAAVEIDDCQGHESFDTGFSSSYAGHNLIGDVIPVSLSKIAFAGNDLRTGLTHRLEHIWFSNIARHGCSPSSGCLVNSLKHAVRARVPSGAWSRRRFFGGTFIGR